MDTESLHVDTEYFPVAIAVTAVIHGEFVLVGVACCMLASAAR
jgi:hypothetical protein